ncbi:MAG TPA: protein kinase [Gemmatimonadales bacterium]|nr:protein kinase [Gemmatimonadales bacterium]
MSDGLRAGLEAALADRYAIERELGRGGMATVYLARDLRHDRPVALKVLHPDLAASLGPERFLREIKLAARLQHPHILTVYDSGEAGGKLWFTMPFVEGESLRDRLRREQQLPIADAVRLTREAALALDFAHRHGAVHRDIKPENILLVDGQALVADFGIARALGAGDERLTETGISIGTPAYMSPEQAAADKGVDSRTDIYSLGIVLYEMLAGEPPFSAPTAQAMIARRLIDTPRPLQEVRETVPDGVSQAVARALAKAPADRFGTAAEFARALEESAGRSTSGAATTAPTVPVAAPKPAARRRVPLTLALAIGFVLGLGVLFGWLRSHRSVEPTGPGTTKLLAVLPFENLGDSTDEYFADGITDEVRGKLATLSGLKVIASSSAGQYKRSAKSPQQIAEELGVQYLLIGKIRWEKREGGQSRVRVSPELVQVSPGSAATTRWQQPFDAALTDVFQVQADIAGRVAQELNVALGDSTQHHLAERPTRNLAAYDAYLKGIEAHSLGGNPVTLRQAVGYFEQAVALDTLFASAWARLSQAASHLSIAGAPSPALAERARDAAGRALALAPDRPEGHAALGDYYRRIPRDYARALDEYAQGERQSPSNAELFRGIGQAEQALGRWEPALQHLRQAQRLDPRSVTVANVLTPALLWTRQYPEALESVARWIALAPANPAAHEVKAMIRLSQGDLAGAKAILEAPPSEVPLTRLVAYFATYYELFWILNDEQQQLLLRIGPGEFDDDRASWGLALAGTAALRGDARLARAYGDSARIALEEQLRAAPEDAQLNVLLGTALAYLGRKADAIREGQKGVALLPISKDAGNGPYMQHQLARIYIMVGEPEKALDQLEPLLRIPYFLSPGWLRLDPTFDPLRKHPRFQKLVESTS